MPLYEYFILWMKNNFISYLKIIKKKGILYRIDKCYFIPFHLYSIFSSFIYWNRSVKRMLDNVQNKSHATVSHVHIKKHHIFRIAPS